MKYFSFLICSIIYFMQSLLGQNISHMINLNTYEKENFNLTFQIFSPSYLNTDRDSISAQKLLWKPFDIPTMGIQTILGLGLAYGAFTLVYPPEVTGNDAAGMKTGVNNVIKGVAVALVLIIIPPSIYGGGDLMGGNGDPWITIGGCLAGFAMGALYARINTLDKPGLPIAITYLVGGLAGYHLSASPIYEQGEQTVNLQKITQNTARILSINPQNINGSNFLLPILSVHF